MIGQAIVVWDATGEYAEGEVVDDNRKVKLLAQGRAVVLPVDAEILGANALAGYVRRSFGRGWVPDQYTPGRGAQLVFYSIPGRPMLHWCARIGTAFERAFKPGDLAARGSLKLMTDTSQRGIALAGGLVPVVEPPRLETLGSPDKDGGWTLQGTSQFSAQHEGFIGLSLYGAASAVRVLWLAVSQTA